MEVRTVAAQLTDASLAKLSYAIRLSGLQHRFPKAEIKKQTKISKLEGWDDGTGVTTNSASEDWCPLKEL